MKNSEIQQHTVRTSRILFALGFGTAFSLLGDATLYTVLPTHTTEAGIALGLVGIILGVNRAVRLIFNSVAGWLYDRFAQRQLFLIGLGIGAFSTVCCAMAQEFWGLLVGRVLWGMAWSLIWVGGGTILLNVVRESECGRWTGLYQTWFFLGIGAGAFIGGVLTDLLGYHFTLWIIAGAQALSIGVVFVVLPAIEQSDGRHTPGVSNVFLNYNFCLAAFLQGLNRFCISGMLAATLGLLVKERLISTGFFLGAATITGVLVASRTVLSMSIAPLAGHLSDRLGSRWQVMFYALLIGGLAMILLTFHVPILILCGFLCSAVIRSSVQSLSITLMGDLVEKRQRGKAISILHTVGDFGSAVGPPCAYVLLFKIGLTGMYWLCAGLFILAGCLVYSKNLRT